MRKILFFFFCCLAVFACSKNDPADSKKYDPDQAIILDQGVLHYDNFPDGWGLYYQTDSSGILILKNQFSSDSLQYEYYKTYVNLHTQLSYKSTGVSGCLYGIGPVCGIPVVEVVSLK